MSQRTLDGAYHPNVAGHVAYGDRIAADLTTDLYPRDGLMAPRLPQIEFGPAFAYLAQHSFRIVTFGEGSGSVRITPPSRGIRCYDDCEYLVNGGAVLNLGFSPDGNSTFAGWGGACSGLGGCTVTIDQAETLFAFFQPIEFTLATNVFGSGAGRVFSADSNVDCTGTCTGRIQLGTVLSLRAVPEAGSELQSWSGVCSGSGPCTVTMDGARAVSATSVPSLVVVPTDFPSGRTPVNVLFRQLDKPGFTFLLIIPVGPIGAPSGFDLGEPRELYQLGTLAEFSGPATVCLEYDDTTFADSSSLRLFHNTGGAAWTDTTIFNYEPGSVICGSVDTLPAASTSVLGVFEAVEPVPAPAVSFTGAAPGTPLDSSSTNIMGSTFAGDVAGHSSGSIVVGIDGVAVAIVVNSETAVHEPPNVNGGLAAVELGRRVVVTADQDFLDAAGSLNDALFTKRRPIHGGKHRNHPLTGKPHTPTGGGQEQ